MKTARFKTTIKCMGCVATVTPFLDKAEGVKSWKVDLQDANRILTANIEDDRAAAAIEEALKQAGYSGEIVDITG